MPLRLPAGAAAVLLLAIAPAAGAGGLGAWDSDGDARVSREEFRAGAGQARLYERWDRDGDGLLSPEEFTMAPAVPPGAYEGWNADRSDWIDESEAMDGYFDSYDADGDLWLDEEEIRGFEGEVGVEGVYE